MGSDLPDLGKGLFGYRKSAVNQIIADRDIMLRQAEGRVRAAEAKLAELEVELSSFRERNSRMDEQVERLRSQLDDVLQRAEAGTLSQAAEPPHGGSSHADEEEGFGLGHASLAGERYSPQDFGREPSVHEAGGPVEPKAGSTDEPEASGAAEREPERRTYGWGDENATAAGTPESATPRPPADDDLPAWARSEAMARPEPSPAPSWDEGVDESGIFGSEPAPEPPWMARLAEQGRTEAPQIYEAPDQAPDEGTASQMDAPQTDAPKTSLAEEPEAPPPSYPGPQMSEQNAEPPAYDEPQVSESNAESPYRQAEPEWMPALPVPPGQQTAYFGSPSSSPPSPPRADDPTSRFLTEELAGILAAAEESAARIVERAQSSTQRQIMESNRLWREVQAEIARFASWRDQVGPVIRQVQSKVNSVRDLVEDVPERIRHALAPMADAISSIDVDMSELASALTPPLLLTPPGPEGEGQSWLSRAPQSSPDSGESSEESSGEAPHTYEGGEPPGPFGAEAG